LAKELARLAITVNAICPGIKMWDYKGEYGPGELRGEWVDGIPLDRAGTPAEVGALVAFLASEHASYSTGPTINVDAA